MNSHDFTKGFVNSKPTRLVGIGLSQNKDKLGRQTFEEVRQERIRFNQMMENEKLFNKKKEVFLPLFYLNNSLR